MISTPDSGMNSASFTTAAVPSLPKPTYYNNVTRVIMNQSGAEYLPDCISASIALVCTSTRRQVLSHTFIAVLVAVTCENTNNPQSIAQTYITHSYSDIEYPLKTVKTQSVNRLRVLLQLHCLAHPKR